MIQLPEASVSDRATTLCMVVDVPLEIARNGFVDDVRAFAVDGDRATATVVYHFERAADDKITADMTFAREGGQWTVCSAGPRKRPVTDSRL